MSEMLPLILDPTGFGAPPVAVPVPAPTVPKRAALPAVPVAEVWGLPLARLSFGQIVDLVERLIERGRPSFFITANLHYAMLCDRDGRLRELNRRAAFVVADGMPLVWYSRLIRQPIPERVTGADLVWHLCARAAVTGHRVFLLGGEPGVGHEAAGVLVRRYPGLQIVGVESPPYGKWSPRQNASIVRRVRRARPDLLIAALGQPKGELWLDAHLESLGVPACVQVGGSLDFVVGRTRRAPVWAQRLGLEWLYRMLQEPRRLAPRYAADAVFLARAIARDAWGAVRR